SHLPILTPGWPAGDGVLPPERPGDLPAGAGARPADGGRRRGEAPSPAPPRAGPGVRRGGVAAGAVGGSRDPRLPAVLLRRLVRGGGDADGRSPRADGSRPLAQRHRDDRARTVGARRRAARPAARAGTLAA